LLTAWVAISLNFVIPRIMPGDPADKPDQPLPRQAEPVRDPALRILFGQKDTGWWQQYLSYWHSIFTGNFGISYAYYPPAWAKCSARACTGR